MQQEVYKGQIVRVTEEKIDHITWERVFLPSGVVIFPLTDDRKILMVEEKRPHENPPVRIKPVSGILEAEKGTPLENALREMREEIGLAGDLELFWTLEGSGTINHKQYFFIARNLTPSKLPNPDGEDTIMSVKAYTVTELLDLYQQDQIKWSMSTLGVFRLHKYLISRGYNS
jgi:8-oxo-dGTP pyrophosphatase MutT (NUDIX family)